MSEEILDNNLLNVIVNGYREEIVSLLKYRKLASSLERLYGSQDLSIILADEERHAKLFLELVKELAIDTSKIGEQALLKEIQLMANEELKIAQDYNNLIESGVIKNKAFVDMLNHLAKDSRRHHSILMNLKNNLHKNFK